MIVSPRYFFGEPGDATLGALRDPESLSRLRFLFVVYVSASTALMYPLGEGSPETLPPTGGFLLLPPKRNPPRRGMQERRQFCVPGQYLAGSG